MTEEIENEIARLTPSNEELIKMSKDPRFQPPQSWYDETVNPFIPVPPMTRTELASRIKEAAYLKGDFTLRSGRKSKYYLDKYLFETQPDILSSITTLMLEHVNPCTTLIAGSELGAVPIATSVSLSSGRPFVIIRTHKKNYGASNNLYEGRIEPSDNVLLLEDVVTTGEQVIKSAETIKREGANLECIVAIIDRLEGAKKNIEKAGFKFTSLFTTYELGINP